MKLPLLVLFAILCGASFATDVSGVPTGPQTSSCGNIQDRLVYSIKTQHVACPLARRIATQWGAQCAQLRTGSCLVTALFYCRYRDTGYESGSIKCIHDADLRKSLRTQRVVSFVTGS